MNCPAYNDYGAMFSLSKSLPFPTVHFQLLSKKCFDNLPVRAMHRYGDGLDKVGLLEQSKVVFHDKAVFQVVRT